MKIFIIGHDNTNKIDVATALVKKESDLDICPYFVTTDDLEDINENIRSICYQLDKETIDIAYKNNAILSIWMDQEDSSNYIGIMYDSYYNNDIVILDIKNFNIIPDNLFEKPTYDDENIAFQDDLSNTINNNSSKDSNVLIIWIDSKYNKYSNSDIMEVEYLWNRLEDLQYLYFCDEDPIKVAKVISKYLHANTTQKIQLLEDWS